jgi:dGTPase
MCKYVAGSDEVSDGNPNKHHERSKVGYFHSEKKLIELIRSETESGDVRNPITFLVEAADDIVYSLVDLEDAVKKSVVTWDQLVESIHTEVGDDKRALELALAKSYEMINCTGMSRKTRDESMAQAFRTFAISVVVPSVVQTFKWKYKEIMDGDYHGELVADCSAAALIKACKNTGKTLVYRAHEIIQLEVMGRRVIHDLMDLFWKGAEFGEKSTVATAFSGKMYKLISKNYRQVCEKALDDIRGATTSNVPERYCRLQLVVDHVAGMTDTFACNLHKMLTNA